VLAVGPATVADPRVRALVDALTAELAGGGYTPEQTFGYSADRLAAAGVHLVAAADGDRLLGIAGLELQEPGVAELKRFYVRPEARGGGVAAALLDALVAYGRERGVRTLRLETGDRQHAAMAFYRKHGFTDIPRFGPYVDSATSVCMSCELGG
jgi:putative acetyltransferase